MDWWTKIRLEVSREESSKREVLRREGMGWETLRKILAHPEPPGYRLKEPRPKPKISPYLERIAQIIEEDKALPKKQRHTAKPIYERLREMGYGGKYTRVKEAVREFLRVKQEVFMPLVHRVGEAQVDFGYALTRVSGGLLRKVGFFVMVLPYSDAFFVMAFERECTESYWEGHVRAFESFGGVPVRISYDNSKVMVSKIVGPRERKLTDGFLKLQSHYLSREHFCRVGRANEKGVVEPPLADQWLEKGYFSFVITENYLLGIRWLFPPSIPPSPPGKGLRAPGRSPHYFVQEAAPERFLPPLARKNAWGIRRLIRN